MMHAFMKVDRALQTQKAWLAGDGVEFAVCLGHERFACRVTGEVLASFEFQQLEDVDLVAAYHRHSHQIDDIARGLFARGLRGPRLAVRAQHLMD